MVDSSGHRGRSLRCKSGERKLDRFFVLSVFFAVDSAIGSRISAFQRVSVSAFGAIDCGEKRISEAFAQVTVKTPEASPERGEGLAILRAIQV
jgi:hypothetical protein